MNSAFPDANVYGYQKLIAELKLPDKNDRHILAAAIKIEADVIVTFNLKDFPKKYIQIFGIRVQHPDEFTKVISELNKEKARQALKNQVKNLKNPPRTFNDVLETLADCGLKETMKKLKK